MWIYASHICTLTIKRAFSTIGALRVTHLAPVPDEVHVQWIDPFRGYLFCEDVVRLVGADLWSE